MIFMYQNFRYDLIMWNLLWQRNNINHGKRVIPEKVSMSVNLLTKIFERKNKSKYNSDFWLNLPMVSICSNIYDIIGYLHQTP
jgi:hypothetical protein